MPGSGNPHRGWRRSLGRAASYALLLVLAGVFLVPLFWMITSALKANYQVLAFPPVWIPRPPRWENFQEALTYLPFGRFALNTIIISLGVILGNLFSATVVAYGFARLRAPGKDFLFIVLLATMMLPYPVTMVPIYVEFNALGWVNTFLPLIVPSFFGVPFYIFLLRQFFLGIPTELEDAARIDGANTAQIIWHVVVPSSKPALAAVAIFSFQATWNDFLPPLIYLHDQSKYTISLGLNFFRSTYTVNWAYLMAASLVTMLPVVILFFFAQRLFIQGITLTGVKG
jgi:ABC-type glycerol-3-phosphate transport system permease component